MLIKAFSVFLVAGYFLIELRSVGRRHRFGLAVFDAFSFGHCLANEKEWRHRLDFLAPF